MTRLLLLLLLCSCADRVEQRRAEQDRVYREERMEFYRSACVKVCKSDFDWCIARKGHSPGACSTHYNDCERECR